MDTTDWTVDDHIEWMRNKAGSLRYANEIWLNVKLSTWEHSMGFTKSVHTLDLDTTTEKYRALGFIQ